MNKPMRQGYETPELAIAGGIAQMAQVKVVGVAKSVEDANERYQLACAARASKQAESVAEMSRLRNNIKRKPLTADEMSELYYPKRRIK